MSVDKSMLAEFLRENPFQPATAIWRSVEVAEVAARSLPAGRGLDMGCGDGHLMKILLDRIGLREFVGVDIDPKETKEAARMAFYARVHTCPADSVPEPAGSFDFAFSNSVLEHIDPIRPVLKEVARLLRPGGRFIMTVPSARFHDCLRGPLFDSASRAEYLSALDARCAHRFYLSQDGWRTLLEECGLRLDVVRPYLSAAEVRRWENISRFTGGILYGLFRKQQPPIEIQRRLGMRGHTVRLPRPLAGLLANLLSAGLSKRETLQGCLLLEAVRDHRLDP